MTRQLNRVYLVEGNVEVRRAVTFALETEGFHVEDYPDARSLLKNDSFAASSCVVIDYNLPDMTGLELVAALRDRGFQVPAILLASLLTPALARRAANLKVPVVEKPLLGDHLLNAVRAVFE